MSLRVLFVLTISVVLAACGGPAGNNATSNGGTEVNANVQAIKSNSVVTNANSPATPAANVPAPAANSPAAKANPLGTPATANTGGHPKPGTTPTPGIPSPAELKKIMSRPVTGDPNTPTMQGAPIMKTNRPLGGRMSGNANKPQ